MDKNGLDAVDHRLVVVLLVHHATLEPTTLGAVSKLHGEVTSHKIFRISDLCKMKTQRIANSATRDIIRPKVISFPELDNGCLLCFSLLEGVQGLFRALLAMQDISLQLQVPVSPK